MVMGGTEGVEPPPPGRLRHLETPALCPVELRPDRGKPARLSKKPAG